LASAETVAVINILFPDQTAVIPEAADGGVISRAAATGSTGVTETGSEYGVFPQILSISFTRTHRLDMSPTVIVVGLVELTATSVHPVVGAVFELETDSSIIACSKFLSVCLS